MSKSLKIFLLFWTKILVLLGRMNGPRWQIMGLKKNLQYYLICNHAQECHYFLFNEFDAATFTLNHICVFVFTVFSIFRSLCIIVRPHLPHFILAKSTFKRHLLTADVKHSASGWRNSHSACHTFLPDSSRKFCIKSDSRTLVQIGAKRYTKVWKGKIFYYCLLCRYVCTYFLLLFLKKEMSMQVGIFHRPFCNKYIEMQFCRKIASDFANNSDAINWIVNIIVCTFMSEICIVRYFKRMFLRNTYIFWTNIIISTVFFTHACEYHFPQIGFINMYKVYHNSHY